MIEVIQLNLKESSINKGFPVIRKPFISFTDEISSSI